MDLPERILVAGVNTRPIVRSAKKLGIEVIAIDIFGDRYVSRHADRFLVSRDESNGGSGPREIFRLCFEVLDSGDPDVAVLSSGMEHDLKRLEELGERIEIAGNEPSQIEPCGQTEKLFDLAEDLDIPHPKTMNVCTESKAIEAAEKIGYPVLLKPPRGGGGIGIEFIEDETDLKDSFRNQKSVYDEDLIVQEYILGDDVSTSVLASGDESRCLTVNEQIIGEENLGVPRKFGYCGNVVPCSKERYIENLIRDYSESLCSELGLRGSNGIDFVVSDKPYLIEVNPRFQNTMDLVEGVLSINLLKEHFRALEGRFKENLSVKKSSAKLIVYSSEDISAPDISRFDDVVDVPKKGSLVKEGDPLCSVLKFGSGREKVVEEAYGTVREVQRFCYSSSRSSSDIEPE